VVRARVDRSYAWSWPGQGTAMLPGRGTGL